MTVRDPRISRREMVKLLGATPLAFGMAGVSAAAQAPRFFSQQEIRFVSSVADTLIPVTDTPGALAAKVPHGLDDLMSGWANARTKAAIRSVLAQMSVTLNELAGGVSFETAAPDVRLKALERFDGLAMGEQRARYAAYWQAKALMVRLYYASEIGATVELRHDSVPGEWLPCIPFADVGRTWAE